MESFSRRVQDIELGTVFTPFPDLTQVPVLSFAACIAHARTGDPVFAAFNLANNVMMAEMFAEHRLDTCPHDLLSLDQIAAIQLYTQPGIFYDYFNGRARDPDRTLLVPLLPL